MCTKQIMNLIRPGYLGYKFCLNSISKNKYGLVRSGDTAPSSGMVCVYCIETSKEIHLKCIHIARKAFKPEITEVRVTPQESTVPISKMEYSCNLLQWSVYVP